MRSNYNLHCVIFKLMVHKVIKLNIYINLYFNSALSEKAYIVVQDMQQSLKYNLIIRHNKKNIV